MVLPALFCCASAYSDNAKIEGCAAGTALCVSPSPDQLPDEADDVADGVHPQLIRLVQPYVYHRPRINSRMRPMTVSSTPPTSMASATFHTSRRSFFPAWGSCM